MAPSAPKKPRKPKKPPPPPPPPRKLDLNELLDRRGIRRATKADMLEIAEEFGIDLAGARNNSARMAILADYEYPAEDE